MNKSISINNEPDYTGFCDILGNKIHLGDQLLFNDPTSGMWTAYVGFYDGQVTIRLLDIKQIRNPINWDMDHDWIASKGWGRLVGSNGKTHWNMPRQGLSNIAGTFGRESEYRKSIQNFKEKNPLNNVLNDLFRPLPVINLSKEPPVLDNDVD